jgi:hypothetical protein
MFKTYFRSRRLSFLALALVALSLLAAPFALIHAQKSKPSKQEDTLESATTRSGKVVTVKQGFKAVKLSANSAGVARIGGGVVGKFECKCTAPKPGKDDADCFLEIQANSISCKPNNCQDCDLRVSAGAAHPIKK